MSAEGEDGYDVADLGVIKSISLPINGKIPGATDAITGVANQEQYDGYFRMARENPDLTAWTRSCLDVQGEVLADLEHTSLSAEDKVAILAGCLVVLHSTLAEWVAPAEFGEEAAA